MLKHLKSFTVITFALCFFELLLQQSRTHTKKKKKRKLPILCKTKVIHPIPSIMEDESYLSWNMGIHPLVWGEFLNKLVLA